jgi:hypothetical protein
MLLNIGDATKISAWTIRKYIALNSKFAHQ